MSSRWRSTSLFLVVLALLVGVWLRLFVLTPDPARRLNVLVVTMESARFAMLGPATMPRTWAWAAGGTRFEQHRAVSAWTGANIVSLLTGESPLRHGVHTRGQEIPRAWHKPLDELRRAGYAVAGLQGFMIVAGFHATGIEVDTRLGPFDWLAARAKDGRPFFLWHHYLETHLPYHPDPAYMPDWETLLPPGDEAARARIAAVMREPAIPAGGVDFRESDVPAIRALYEANFRAFDDWFMRLIAHLHSTGLDRNTIVVLTADHGEEHLDHGARVGHASTTRDGHLHEELVHVPMVLHLPPDIALSASPPRVVSGLTDHLDVMPTLFRLLGRVPGRPLGGHDMLRETHATRWSGVTSRAGFAEPDPADMPVWHHARIAWPWKLHLVAERGRIVARKLYDLAADPAERDDKAAARPDIVAQLEPELAASIGSVRLDAYRPERLVEAPAPSWRWPNRGGTWHHADLDGRFALEWDGASHVPHVVQYVAGSGATSLAGEIRVDGTRLGLEPVDVAYWNTWVVPYGTLKLRVGVAGRDDRWSDWLQIELAK